MDAIYTQQKGKTKATCTISGCGWSSKWLPDMSGAHQELSRHNYRKHPGVFPRWNPDIRAVEPARRQG